MVKHAQTIHRQLPTNCLSVFDRIVNFVLKGLIYRKKKNILYVIETYHFGSTWIAFSMDEEKTCL